MLTVDDDELIRQMHVMERWRTREARRRLSHSRNTITKSLAHLTPSDGRMALPGPKRVLEPYLLIIDAWLVQGKTPLRKQHQGTSQKINERLCKDRDDRGSVITPPDVCGGRCRRSAASTGSIHTRRPLLA